MSSARAEFFTPAGEFIGYGVYSGTSDVLAPHVSQECDWVEGGWDRLETCEHDGEPCVIYSDYGGGNHWPSTLCRECRVVKGRLSPYPTDYGYSLPTPEMQADEKAWREAGWPKKGHPFPAWSPTETSEQ